MVKTMNKAKRERKTKAYGLIDSIINKMPEIHIPTYQYAGPGTRLEKRLARGDPGKNKLDVACKHHDLAYAACENSKSRSKADKILIEQAFKRICSRDAKLDERAAALLVSALMSAKVGLTKIGLGLTNSRPKRKMSKERTNRMTKRKYITFSKLIHAVKKSIKKRKLSNLNDISSKNAIKAAIRRVQIMKRGKTVKIPRILKLPKIGASLHTILPILSGLSAVGSIAASAAGVVKAVKDIEIAKKRFIRENGQQKQTTGEIKIGRALNLIYKADRNVSGSGFYLKPYQAQR